MAKAKGPVENVIKTYWRPATAWQYIFVCIFDFVLAPAFAIKAGSSWDPLTLHGSGLYHMSMGAVIGAASWTRGLEKINEAKNTVPASTPVDVPEDQQ